MKKIFYFSIAFIMAINITHANTVSSGSAQTIASNFYKQNTHKEISNITLAYTEISATGDPIFYAFNMNGKEGFVIVSAEDAGHPIIGYSTEGNFVVPNNTANSNLYYWMHQRKKEITEMRKQNVQATLEIKNEWKNYLNNKNIVPQTLSTVAPLVQSTWDQSGGGTVPYNALCPGGSVTGCVATAMAQIIRYWSYPATGTGASSYCDCSTLNPNYGQNYGVLSVNYATETYNWSAMPLDSSSAGAAQIAYDCGVSVAMDYNPGGSGAQVIAADGPFNAQKSLVTYFGYDPATIQGLDRSNYSDAIWIQMLDNELNMGRPINYVGSDLAWGEGHSWVCDGYDASNFFHMNWGWGGYDNGYFSINNLQTTNGNFNPSDQHEAIIGIQPPPPPTNSLDAGVFSINSPSNITCDPIIFTPQVIIRNFGSDTLKSTQTILINLKRKIGSYPLLLARDLKAQGAMALLRLHPGTWR